MTRRAQTLLKEAKSFLKAADEKESSASADKWAAAERMWQANKEEGLNQREIAKTIGLALGTVSNHVRLWEAFRVQAPGQRPTFTEAYAAMFEDGSSRPTDMEERIAGRVLKDPEKRERVIERLPADTQRDVARDVVRASARRAEPQLGQARSEMAADGTAEEIRKTRERSEAMFASQELTSLSSLARHAVRELVSTYLAKAERLDPEVRQLVDEEIEEDRSWIERAYTALFAPDMDAALAEILAEADADPERRSA